MNIGEHETFLSEKEKSPVLVRLGNSPAFGDSGGIQTHNLLIRSQMLYSVELRNLFRFAGAKVRTIFDSTK